MIKGTSIPNQKLYVDLGNELTKNGDLKAGLLKLDTPRKLMSNTFSYLGDKNISEISSEQVFGDNGLLSLSHPNFESRANQKICANG